MANCDGLGKTQIFGFADKFATTASPLAARYVYRINGEKINGEYELTIEATDFTDQCTYTSSFSLASLQGYMSNNKDYHTYPETPEETLQWVRTAFGRQGSGGPKAELNIANGGQGAVLRALYYVKGRGDILIKLPPEKGSLQGNLSSAQASVLRSNLSFAAAEEALKVRMLESVIRPAQQKAKGDPVLDKCVKILDGEREEPPVRAPRAAAATQSTAGPSQGALQPKSLPSSANGPSAVAASQGRSQARARVVTKAAARKGGAGRGGKPATQLTKIKGAPK